MFFGEKANKDLDSASFEILEPGYAKARKRVYHQEKVWKGTDLVSFEVLENTYNRDVADKSIPTLTVSMSSIQKKMTVDKTAVRMPL